MLCALVVLALGISSAALEAQDTRARLGDIPVNHRGFLGIQLSRDSLASVRQRLGYARDWTTGDGGESEVWWCYRSGSDTRAAILLIASSGEMGGPEHEVDQIRLSGASRAD